MPKETTLEEFDRLVAALMPARDGMHWFHVNMVFAAHDVSRARATLRDIPLHRIGLAHSQIQASDIGAWVYNYGHCPSVRHASMVIGQLITLRDHPES